MGLDDTTKDFVALNACVNDDIVKKNFSAARLKALMQTYNDSTGYIKYRALALLNDYIDAMPVDGQIVRNDYKYRSFPYNCVEPQTLWSVCGIDLIVGDGGVLEWCTSMEDANERLEEMMKFPLQFKGLRVEKDRE